MLAVTGTECPLLLKSPSIVLRVPHIVSTLCFILQPLVIERTPCAPRKVITSSLTLKPLVTERTPCAPRKVSTYF